MAECTPGSPGAHLSLFAYVGDPTPAANANLEYIGWALTGTPTSVPSWLIAKLTYHANGNFITLKWADPDRHYVSIWDNRAALSYT